MEHNEELHYILIITRY